MLKLFVFFAFIFSFNFVQASTTSLNLGLFRSKPLSQDEHFVEAREAFRVGEARKLAYHAAFLSNHILKPYVDYWQLRLNLALAKPQDIHRFFERYPGSWAGQNLLNDWLQLLGKKKEWGTFLSELPALVNEDPDITCYALQARAGKQDPLVLSELRSLWFTAKELPSSCTPLIKAALNQGYLTIDDLWARMRFLLESERVSYKELPLNYFPRSQAPSSWTIRSIAKKPQNYFKKLPKDLRNRTNRELVIFALQRLVRADPDLAASYWNENLRQHFSNEERTYVWAQFAVAGARKHHPLALQWYAKAEEGKFPFDDEQASWRARAALRSLDWHAVQTAIEKMSPARRSFSSWIYWHGRALKAQGKSVEANEQFLRISSEPHFYGQLAAEELGKSFSLPPKAESLSEEEIRNIAQNVGLNRALTLYRLGMKTEGNREWLWTIRNMGDRQLLAAAELAKQNKIFDLSINTADQTVAQHDFSLRYLAPFHDSLIRHARPLNLDDALLLGLIRQESRFITNAISSSGALGLMQLRPDTAHWVAKRIRFKGYHKRKLHEPETNIALGSHYFKIVLDNLYGHPVLASAAYNAGPSRAKRWMNDVPLEGAIYAETIPFTETRDYVKKVMANAMCYAALLGSEPRSLKSRLGIIAGRKLNEESKVTEYIP